MPNEQLLRVYDPLHQLQQEPQQIQEPQQLQQEKNVFQEETEAMLMRNSELQSSSYKRFGMTFKDSAEMTEVKQAQQALTDGMFGEMPADKTQLDAAVDALLPLYDRLINACTVYVNKNEGVGSAPGQARLRIVRGSLHLATAERSMFRDCARTVFDEAAGGPAPFWVNVLGEIRRVKVTVAEKDTELGGGGTSDVTIIKQGSSQKFFKEEEKLLSPKDEFTAHYLTGKSKKDAAFYRQFLQTIGDDSYCPLKIVLNHFAPSTGEPVNLEDVYDHVVYDLQENFKEIDWKDKKVRAAFIEMAPKLHKWFTRWGICGVAGIAPNSLLSTRNVATSRMAMMLGMPELVADSSTVLLQVGDRQAKRGNLMKQAVGKDNGKLTAQANKNGEPITYTPEMARQLSTLQLFDTICGQLDRNTGNYFVQEKFDGRKHILSSLQGIDNDFSFGTLRYAELKSDGGLLKLPQMEIDGLCTLPCVDEQAVTAIQALNDEIVKHAFADLLSSAEIDALLDRLHGVQNILRKTAAKKKDFVVPGKDWNEDTLRRFGRVQNANPYVKREYV